MMFDPFGDFDERGYLRNIAGLKNLDAVKEFEHRVFLDKLPEAMNAISNAEWISYRDVLNTHKILFSEFYPWAGQDRAQTTPDFAVSKGPVLFAHPEDAQGAVEYALRTGQDKITMAARPGEVMGYLAYGHPFLDGNGRAIMVVHTELAQRAGISVEWAATSKGDYLTALTKELQQPGKGHLDAYLKPYVGPAIEQARLASHVARTPGLDGKSPDRHNANEIAGRFSDPALQARYRHQQARRRQSEERGLAAPAGEKDTERGERDEGSPSREISDSDLAKQIKRDFATREKGDRDHGRDDDHTNSRGRGGRTRPRQ